MQGPGSNRSAASARSLSLDPAHASPSADPYADDAYGLDPEAESENVEPEPTVATSAAAASSAAGPDFAAGLSASPMAGRVAESPAASSAAAPMADASAAVTPAASPVPARVRKGIPDSLLEASRAVESPATSFTAVPLAAAASSAAAYLAPPSAAADAPTCVGQQGDDEEECFAEDRGEGSEGAAEPGCEDEDDEDDEGDMLEGLVVHGSNEGLVAMRTAGAPASPTILTAGEDTGENGEDDWGEDDRAEVFRSGPPAAPAVVAQASPSALEEAKRIEAAEPKRIEAALRSGGDDEHALPERAQENVEEGGKEQFEEKRSSVSQEDAVNTLGPALLEQGAIYTKLAMVFLRKAVPGMSISVFDDDEVRVLTAQDGDWIVQADTEKKDRFLLPDWKVQRLYEETPLAFAGHPDAEELEEDGFEARAPCGPARCLALRASAALLEQLDDSSFTAAWGGVLLVEEGDYFVAPVSPGGVGMPTSVSEVYRIERATFLQTYAEEIEVQASKAPEAFQTVAVDDFVVKDPQGVAATPPAQPTAEGCDADQPAQESLEADLNGVVFAATSETIAAVTPQGELAADVSARELSVPSRDLDSTETEDVAAESHSVANAAGVEVTCESQVAETGDVAAESHPVADAAGVEAACESQVAEAEDVAAEVATGTDAASDLHDAATVIAPDPVTPVAEIAHSDGEEPDPTTPVAESAHADQEAAAAISPVGAATTTPSGAVGSGDADVAAADSEEIPAAAAASPLASMGPAAEGLDEVTAAVTHSPAASSTPEASVPADAPPAAVSPSASMSADAEDGAVVRLPVNRSAEAVAAAVLRIPASSDTEADDAAASMTGDEILADVAAQPSSAAASPSASEAPAETEAKAETEVDVSAEAAAQPGAIPSPSVAAVPEADLAAAVAATPTAEVAAAADDAAEVAADAAPAAAAADVSADVAAAFAANAAISAAAAAEEEVLADVAAPASPAACVAAEADVPVDVALASAMSPTSDGAADVLADVAITSPVHAAPDTELPADVDPTDPAPPPADDHNTAGSLPDRTQDAPITLGADQTDEPEGHECGPCLDDATAGAMEDDSSTVEPTNTSADTSADALVPSSPGLSVQGGPEAFPGLEVAEGASGDSPSAESPEEGERSSSKPPYRRNQPPPPIITSDSPKQAAKGVPASVDIVASAVGGQSAYPSSAASAAMPLRGPPTPQPDTEEAVQISQARPDPEEARVTTPMPSSSPKQACSVAHPLSGRGSRPGSSQQRGSSREPTAGGRPPTADGRPPTADRRPASRPASPAASPALPPARPSSRPASPAASPALPPVRPSSRPPSPSLKHPSRPASPAPQPARPPSRPLSQPSRPCSRSDSQSAQQKIPLGADPLGALAVSRQQTPAAINLAPGAAKASPLPPPRAPASADAGCRPRAQSSQPTPRTTQSAEPAPRRRHSSHSTGPKVPRAARDPQSSPPPPPTPGWEGRGDEASSALTQTMRRRAEKMEADQKSSAKEREDSLLKMLDNRQGRQRGVL